MFTLMMIGFIVIQFYIPFVQAASKTKFSIVYTNDVMGEVEPCG